jgi:hypothetical protein
MTNRITAFLMNEAVKVLYGFLFTAIMIILLAALRAINVSNFLFIQIVFVSVSLLVLTYFFSRLKWANKRIRGNEIYLVLFAFTISSFLLLNVDRSRSVYLLKWVDAAGANGITSLELSSKASVNDLGQLALNQRIDEQIESGNLIRDSEGNLQTSNQGKILNSIFKLTAKFLNLTGYNKS